MRISTIGFIGLGNMGHGMATNLLAYCQQHQCQLMVSDLDAQKVNALVKQGAVAAKDIDHLASQSEVIFTSLPSSKEVNLVALGNQTSTQVVNFKGIFSSTKKGAVWIDTSTNDIGQWQQLKQAAPDTLTLIDAPVTGGAEGAAAGTLTVLLGCEQADLIRVQPILDSIASRVMHMGPSGAGYVTKLVQLHLNYLVAQGIGEALMLGKQANIDLTQLHKVLQHSCAQSYVVDTYIPKVLDGSYDTSFALGLAAKDMRLISSLGKHLHTDLPLADMVCTSYQQATQTYGETAPHLSVVKLLEDAQGKLLR